MVDNETQILVRLALIGKDCDKGNIYEETIALIKEKNKIINFFDNLFNKCTHCDGRGEIGGWTGKGEYDQEECPSCKGLGIIIKEKYKL